MKGPLTLGAAAAVTLALCGVLSAADDECGAPRCRGLAPSFLTEALAPLPLGRDTVVPVEIRGNNEGSYFSFTGLTPKTEKVRSIHLELARDQLNKDAARELQQRVTITFGMCAVSGTTTTCRVTLRGKATGPIFVPIKALDQCLRDDCAAPSGKGKHAYTTRTFSTRVVD
jgi:hypothetical protein